MKCIIFLTFLTYFLSSSGSPIKMFRSFNQSPLPLTHNLMYVQYLQPKQTSAIRTYSDGQLVGTESYTKDCGDEKTTDYKIDLNAHNQQDDTVGHFDYNNVYNKISETEYPKDEFQHTVENQPDNISEITSKDEYDEKTEQPQITTTPNSYEEKPIQNPVRSSVLNPETYIPPKKRVYVDLEYPNVDQGYPDIDYFHKKIERKPTTANKNDKPVSLPIGTYFPLHFGENSGSTIAVANSFSTGSGGSAVSHAIAYGNPNTAHGSKEGQLKRN